jgi:hypothetical protein
VLVKEINQETVSANNIKIIMIL